MKEKGSRPRIWTSEVASLVPSAQELGGGRSPGLEADEEVWVFQVSQLPGFSIGGLFGPQHHWHWQCCLSTHKPLAWSLELKSGSSVRQESAPIGTANAWFATATEPRSATATEPRCGFTSKEPSFKGGAGTFSVRQGRGESPHIGGDISGARPAAACLLIGARADRELLAWTQRALRQPEI